GTQMSEGRGTTRPFELVGAPHLDPEEYGRRLDGLGLPGVSIRPTVFQPTFQKHAGCSCGGVQIHVRDRAAFAPVKTGVAVVGTAYAMDRDAFRWKQPPYEYVFDKNPFDVIAGTSALREAIEAGTSPDEIAASWRAGEEAFRRQRRPCLLY